MLNENAGIVENVVISNHGDHYDMILRTGNNVKNLEHIHKELEDNWQFADIKLDFIDFKSLILIAGPKALSELQKYIAANLSNIGKLKSYSVEMPHLNEQVRITRLEEGYFIAVSNENVVRMTELLQKKGVIKPAGLGALNTLRIESGTLCVGIDTRESTTPFDAGLMDFVDKSKLSSGSFIGSAKLKEVCETDKQNSKRVGFIVKEGPPAREGYDLYNARDLVLAGKVSSGTFSPSLKKSIGMAYVRPSFSMIGTKLKVKIRNKLFDVTVCKIPFV